MHSSISKIAATVSRPSWTKRFLYPSMSIKSIGEAAFLWDGEQWVKGDAQEVWVMPADKDFDRDPPAKLKVSDDKVRVYTKAGFSFGVPRDACFRVAVGNSVHTVITAPSVYEVHFGVGKHLIFGFWGYDEVSKRVALFSPIGLDCVKFGAECYNPAFFIEDEEEQGEKTSPSFGFEAPYEPAVEDMPEHTPQQIKRKSSKITKEVVPIVPVHSREYVEKQEQLLREKGRLTAKYAELVSPTHELKVPVVSVVGGKLTKIERHRSSIEEDEEKAVERPGEEELFEDPIEKARKLMKMTDTTLAPMPINPPYIPNEA